MRTQESWINDEWEDEWKDEEMEEDMPQTRSKGFYVIYWLTVLAVLALVIGIAILAPPKAHATELTTGQVTLTTEQATLTTQASSNPYTDVSTKTVDKGSVQAVSYVKAHKGFVGVIKGKRYYPLKTFNRAQFVRILTNFYGAKKVPITASDLQNAKKPVTAKYATSKFVAVAKRIGIPIKWTGNNKKLSRASVAKYLQNFAKFDSAFRPRH